jgi:hypothetical protein
VSVDTGYVRFVVITGLEILVFLFGLLYLLVSLRRRYELAGTYCVHDIITVYMTAICSSQSA